MTPSWFDKSLRIRQFSRDVCDVPLSPEKR
jgi:hypothetical protein